MPLQATKRLLSDTRYADAYSEQYALLSEGVLAFIIELMLQCAFGSSLLAPACRTVWVKQTCMYVAAL